jgi:hypothetical protein
MRHHQCLAGAGPLVGINAYRSGSLIGWRIGDLFRLCQAIDMKDVAPSPAGSRSLCGRNR